MVILKSKFKTLIRDKSLFYFRLKKIKQLYVMLRLSFSGQVPFEQKVICIRDLKFKIEEARRHISQNNMDLLVFTDCERLLGYCLKVGIKCVMVKNEANIDLPESSGKYFVIYAVNKYSNGRRVGKWILENKVPFLSVEVDLPSNFLSECHEAESAMREAFEKQVTEGWDKFDLHVGGDFENLLEAIYTTRNVKGSYVEIGVFNGSSADVALRFMTKLGLKRRCVFMDSFDSFAYSEAVSSIDRHWKGTHTEVDENLTRCRLERYNNNNLKVEVRKANICSKGVLDDIAEIACVNIDVDLYEAVIMAWKSVYPKLSVGGMVLIEDAGHVISTLGARLALDRILIDHPDFIHFRTFSGQHVLIKPHSSDMTKK